MLQGALLICCYNNGAAAIWHPVVNAALYALVYAVLTVALQMVLVSSKNAFTANTSIGMFFP